MLVSLLLTSCHFSKINKKRSCFGLLVEIEVLLISETFISFMVNNGVRIIERQSGIR